jgi:hypothetical protein
VVTIPDLERLVGRGILAFGRLELILDGQTQMLAHAAGQERKDLGAFKDRVQELRRLLDLVSDGHRDFMERFDKFRGELKEAEEFRAKLAHGHLSSPVGVVIVLRHGRPEAELTLEDLEAFPETVERLRLDLLLRFISHGLKFAKGNPPAEPGLDPPEFRKLIKRQAERSQRRKRMQDKGE